MNQISLGAFANFNSAVPWGLWVSIYLWFVGASAGIFLLVMWGNLVNNPHIPKLNRLATILSLSTLLAGLLSIQIDLGHIERFYKLFLSPSPTSAMAWMVWLYGIYAVILVGTLLKLRKGLPKLFLGLGALFSLAVIVVESLLFAVPPGKQWHSLIFCLHFITSSLGLGIAAIIFIAGALGTKLNKIELLKGLVRISIPLIIINLAVEIMEAISLNHIGHLENRILVVMNLLAVILLLRNNIGVITCGAAIGLLGILLSKYNSLISSQLVEPFKGFGSAYIEPRLGFSYSPSAFEIWVSLALVVSVGVIFYFLHKILPLTREEAL